jgi:hypothetical protein
MKYFTPERYLRLGNLSEERAFRAAHKEWERAVAHYKSHLQRVQGDLPSGLRRLIESVYLHDAKVLDMWQGQVSRFTITLQPESTPSQLVVLAYSLVGPPRVQRDVLPDTVRSQPVTWLYDELDVEQSTADGKGSHEKVNALTIVHDVLLSNGWEIRLRSRDVVVTRPIRLIPAPPDEDRSRATAS